MDSDLIAGILALLWWRHDEEKADAKADAVEAVADEVAHSKNRNAPRAWAAVTDEWKD